MPPRFQLALWTSIGGIVAWLSAALIFVLTINHGSGTLLALLCATAVVVIVVCYGTPAVHVPRRRILTTIAVCCAVTVLSPAWATTLELNGDFLFSFVPAFFGVVNRLLLLTMTLVFVVLLLPIPGTSMNENKDNQQSPNIPTP